MGLFIFAICLIAAAICFALGNVIGHGAADKARDTRISQLRFDLAHSHDQLLRQQKQIETLDKAVTELRIRNQSLESSNSTFIGKGLALSMELHGAVTTTRQQPFAKH